MFKRYWFPNMRCYIKNFLEACPICMLKKPGVKKRRPPSVVMYEEFPLDRIQADLVELSQHLVRDERYKYLITVVDHHSKKAWAKLIRRKKAEIVISFVE
jgi:hypothetical protein